MLAVTFHGFFGYMSFQLTQDLSFVIVEKLRKLLIECDRNQSLFISVLINISYIHFFQKLIENYKEGRSE